MADDSFVLVGLRTKFYRDAYRKVVLVFFLSLIINIGLGGILFYKWTHPPLPRYFPTSANGRITPLKPLSEPGISDEEVAQWTAQAVLAAYNYNYLTWKQDLQSASQFFTDNGWTRFQEALQTSRMLDALTSHKWIVTSAAQGAPIILKQTIVPAGFYAEARYAWRIRVNIEVQYVGYQDFSVKKYAVTAAVIRVSTLNAPRGIGIEQFVVDEI